MASCYNLLMLAFLKSPSSIAFSKRTLAILALILIAYAYSTLGMVSRILNEGFQPMTQVYVRVAIGFLISLLFFRHNLNYQKIITTPRQDWFWLTVMGAIGYAVCVWFLTLGAISAKLVNGSVIYSTIPFFVYIISYFLLKEKFRLKLILFLLVAVYGIAVVASKSFIPQLSGFGMGEMFTLVGAFTGAWWSVGIKKLSNHLRTTEVTMLVMAIAAISGIIIAMLQGETLQLSSFSNSWIVFGIVLGAGLNFMTTFLENFAFKHINVVLGNQILMVSTVFSLLNGFVFYQELITWPELIGGLLIFGSVVAANNVLEKS